ncbi:hypothetical protein AXK60_24600 [Tsukamurella pseudospumae]|uniref:Uncharacterized protein n=1 Tax=Tsukamurella pseudospumae TaxID=239498 RepID=A0A138AMP2_9ACTN|nr:hypothetical protein AXK61_03350 [Tsukamurella pseudospumae]KXP11682.1 hypothetical protein AXK60_24600 [Tsukamurella pseudospumae]
MTISKIENNIRGGRTDIAEISILAVALGVSPLVLVYPDLDDTPVQLYPGVEWPGISAALWATGSHFASGPVPPNYAAHAYVTTAFEVDRLRTDLDLTTSLLGKLSGKSEPDRVRDTMRRQEQIHDLLKERERDLAELRESWVSGPKGYALESSLVEATDG